MLIVICDSAIGLAFFSFRLNHFESESESVLSCVRLFVTLWTVAYQAPLSMGFSRQEYWWVAFSYSEASS